MERIRIRLRVTGIVQGVGFRPFIHRLITAYGLSGWIRNTSAGVEGEIQGDRNTVEEFLIALRKEKPRLSYIEAVEKEEIPVETAESDFRIEESRFLEETTTLISPDLAVCPDCLREMRDPANRRYRYPFINCTNCGPRFTIIRNVPYDRERTTMAPFVMCPECGSEYEDIEDRRYHAQPNCCEVCGPELYYIDSAQTQDLIRDYPGKNCQEKEIQDDPAGLAAKALKSGKILAIKGLGGFHLVCRCDEPELAMKLRQRKHRDEKPFAIMCADLKEAERICFVSETEKELLEGHERPIVLLRKKNPKSMSHISENHRIGVMLPYTPVHELLFDEELRSLIMTSANFSDCPILYKDEQALEGLKEIVDGFLMTNRKIHTRCDDSLLWEADGKAYFARRSRGYAPFPVIKPGTGRKILACGAEQKATFSLTKGRYVFPSQHIGDLKNAEAFENYREQIEHFETLFDIQPEMIACDLHPDYLSAGYAQERAEKEGLPLVKIQHHFAHMASCMADNGLTGPCIGIIWDGTGYGTDGTAWGGEFLTGDYTGFMRQGTIRPIRLPGGDRAAKEIWRIGCSLLHDVGYRGRFSGERENMVERILDLGINCTESTGMGRLFDGISAILGIKEQVSYEGQGAIMLESAAISVAKQGKANPNEKPSDSGTDRFCGKVYPYRIGEKDGLMVFDHRPMVRTILQDQESQVPVSECAVGFMNTLICMAADMCYLIRKKTGLVRVVLSGGTFQNMYLLKNLKDRLTNQGFEVYIHHRVSTNDEGISLGQTMIAEHGGGEYVSGSSFGIDRD